MFNGRSPCQAGIRRVHLPIGKTATQVRQLQGLVKVRKFDLGELLSLRLKRLKWTGSLRERHRPLRDFGNITPGCCWLLLDPCGHAQLCCGSEYGESTTYTRTLSSRRPDLPKRPA
ncbi:uncharacterized protein LOC108047669 [Drosophila rhopaloa]|uniref:Uncharacterized protein LOC108047669 n=1 Tax=Drosophila rhopaloa TaxID=1041015 RepID=A0A6P4EZ85_DRORH|nr:uncharacterized protein LOC108047669 [Drosophila rhopaloa]